MVLEVGRVVLLSEQVDVDEDRALPHVVHGRVVDKVEPAGVVLGDVVHSQEDWLAALLAATRVLNVALHVHVDLAHALRLDHMLMDVPGHGGGRICQTLQRSNETTT